MGLWVRPKPALPSPDPSSASSLESWRRRPRLLGLRCCWTWRRRRMTLHGPWLGNRCKRARSRGPRSPSSCSSSRLRRSRRVRARRSLRALLDWTIRPFVIGWEGTCPLRLTRLLPTLPTLHGVAPLCSCMCLQCSLVHSAQPRRCPHRARRRVQTSPRLHPRCPLRSCAWLGPSWLQTGTVAWCKILCGQLLKSVILQMRSQRQLIDGWSSSCAGMRESRPRHRLRALVRATPMSGARLPSARFGLPWAAWASTSPRCPTPRRPLCRPCRLAKPRRHGCHGSAS
mmetsp:Transcript_72981/g.209483  ORF Transcript_72981/g.209483 Transcript_72981/m.209483 type:complete len:285 (+) Transcript_72981:387-1241(+)